MFLFLSYVFYRYFGQEDILAKVPSCFLLIGGVYALIQLIGVILLSEPPEDFVSTIDRKNTPTPHLDLRWGRRYYCCGGGGCCCFFFRCAVLNFICLLMSKCSLSKEKNGSFDRFFHKFLYNKGPPKKLFGCPPLPTPYFWKLEKSFYCTKVYHT